MNEFFEKLEKLREIMMTTQDTNKRNLAILIYSFPGIGAFIAAAMISSVQNPEPVLIQLETINHILDVIKNLSGKFEQAKKRTAELIANTLGAQAIKLYEERKAYKETVMLLETTLKASKIAENMNLISATHLTLGVLYSDLRRFDEAEKHYKAALEIRERLAKEKPEAYEPDLAMVHLNLGNLYWNLRRFDEAEKHYKAALEIYDKLAKEKPEAYVGDLVGVLSNLVVMLIDNDEVSVAEYYVRRLRNIVEEVDVHHSALIFAYSALGRFFEVKGDYEGALEYYERGVLSLARVWFSLPSRVDAQINALLGAPWFVRFGEFVFRALERVPRDKKVGFVKRALDVFERAKVVELLKDLRGIEVAGELLKELLEIDAELKTVYDQLLSFRSTSEKRGAVVSVDYLVARISELEEKKRELRRRILEQGIASSAVFAEVSLSEVYSLFPDALIVSFAPYYEDGFIVSWLDLKYSEGNVSIVDLGRGLMDLVNSSIRDTLAMLFGSHNYVSQRNVVSRVRRVLKWLPNDVKNALSRAADEGRTIIVSPIGILHDVSWEFFDPDNKGPIGLRCPIIRVYCLPSIVLAKKRFELLKDSGSVSSVIVGVEDPNDPRFYLPNISEECTTVSNYLPSPKIHLIMGKETLPMIDSVMNSIKEEFRRCSIFYFSGHGFFILPAEQSSLLIFIQDGKPIRITAEELPIIRPSVPGLFAFLNACQTAKTHSFSPPGSLIDARAGFIHALFLSGYCAVIASLWSIRDDVARTFAEEFFSRLRRGASWREALLGARKSTFEKHPDSVDWAAFVVYGYPEAITLSP